MSHVGGYCGSSSCRACRREFARRVPHLDRGYWAALDIVPPTEDGLRKHALRYGPDGVREIAGIYGIVIDPRSRS